MHVCRKCAWGRLQGRWVKALLRMLPLSRANRNGLTVLALAMASPDGRFLLLGRTSAAIPLTVMAGGGAGRVGVEADLLLGCTALLQTIAPDLQLASKVASTVN